MALTYSTPAALGSKAADFSLKGVDGKIHRLQDFKEARALVVVFMCNHCPYVKATLDRVNALAKEYAVRGVRVVGISSNDVERYPDDGFEPMKEASKELGFAFPYLWDETQEVAEAYGAACTPEFFAYAQDAGQWVLRYKGRLDDNWKDPAQVTRRDLALALDAILAGRQPDADQKPAMGCGIKWAL